MRLAAILCSVLFVVGALLFLVQLWFEPMAAEVFIKILITLGVAFVVVLGASLARKEYIENKKMKDSGYLD